MHDLTFPSGKPGQSGIGDRLQRVDAEVFDLRRLEGTTQLSVRVKLRFRLRDQIESRTGELTTTIELNGTGNFHSRRTKRRIIAAAWEWLDAYFDGIQLGMDCHNLFSDILDIGISTNDSDITPADERTLQLELRRIEQEFSA